MVSCRDHVVSCNRVDQTETQDMLCGFLTTHNTTVNTNTERRTLRVSSLPSRGNGMQTTLTAHRGTTQQPLATCGFVHSPALHRVSRCLSLFFTAA